MEKLTGDITRLNEQIAVLRMIAHNSSAGIARLEEKVAGIRAIAASALDGIPDLRRELLAARATDEYKRALTDPEPLVTIRIPTYVRAGLLVERALPSIMRQTYQNFEVIVVGDGCTNDTAERIEAFGDPRVRFVNLPYRYPYPDDAEHRWMVAGAPGVNFGTELAQGTWLAMLGDDDELEPHHLECLLETARSTRSEMVYGNILQRQPPPLDDVILARYPPELGRFQFQAAIFMSALRRFEFSTKSWLLDEPSDWNLCRRMLEAGVRIGYIDRVVTIWYPSKTVESDSGE
jgi:glycosyltransferase involved in cell wall biosynthesis